MTDYVLAENELGKAIDLIREASEHLSVANRATEKVMEGYIHLEQSGLDAICVDIGERMLYCGRQRR